MSTGKPFLLLAVLTASLSAAPSPGEERPAGENDLARAVTADSFLCIVSKGDPGDDFFRESTKRVMGALKASGFIEELTGGFLDLMPDEIRESAGGLVDRIQEVLWRIDWPALADFDHVFAERLKDGVVQFFWLVEGDEAFAAKAAKEARYLLEGVVLITDELKLVTERYRGAEITSLRLVETDVLDVSVLRRGGLLGFTFGSSTGNPREYLDQLDGQSGKPGLVDTERYRKAFAGLPSRGAMRTYFDIDRMIASMKARFERLLLPSSREKKEEAILDFIFTLFEELAIFEYTSEIRYKEGDTLIARSTLKLKPGASDRAFYRFLFDREPVTGFERYVPAEAVSFSVNAGVDFLSLYRLALRLIEEKLPDAGEFLAGWEKIQETHGIHLEKDLLERIEGRMVSVEMPAGKPGMMGKTVSISMVGLDAMEAGQAGAWLAGLLEKLKELVKRVGIQVTLKEVPVGRSGRGFEIYQSVFPFFRPFVCVQDDFLVFSTAREETLAYLAFLEKGGATILENDAFRALALDPPSRLHSIHYKNMENTVEDFKSMMSILGMVSMAIPAESEDTRVLKHILMTLPRLVPVVEAMDVYASEVGYSVYDPETKRMEMKSVTALKEP